MEVKRPPFFINEILLPDSSGLQLRTFPDIFIAVPEIIILESNAGLLKLNFCYRFND